MINPKRALEKLETFVQDYKERVKNYIPFLKLPFIKISKKRAFKAIIEEDKSLEDMAEFYEGAIRTFEEFEAYGELMQEHKESIVYFKKNIARYL